ncbi:NADPH:adrenodoxin oxidoreductase, mitochondrial-like isoform X2 [Xenia sp. Carnegie-2017]|uniref:NADPH:adrenodoxin oxidoreductase, mitochondrial-like isoform X2 n=1 Tax=Xenia sp. Carnegie-2017 TaxID=2897299 RepID=UPI001F03CD40|nr:NADPH:adrenodoxin oxidoreductase, mitochondrial-like isoform X2 [Xenia sp. Carnegie-2017]
MIFMNYLNAHNYIFKRLAFIDVPNAGNFVRRCWKNLSTLRNGETAVCIVGSGPAGFYTAQYLLKFHQSIHVDIYEKLPVPFGLVRYGVAPDHPETKNCINQFTATVKNERCQFFGNVNIGKDILLKELKSCYDAVILCYGAQNDRKLEIPGEDTHGVYSARSFVEWYNGLPASRELMPDLSSETAVILGQGNVALDVSRILLKPVSMLEQTDISEYALKALRESKVRKVYVVGRRGPRQTSFTIKELREMLKLPGCRSVFEREDFLPLNERLSEVPRQKRRLLELLCKTALNPPEHETCSFTKEFKLKFCRSPVEILRSEMGNVSGIKFEVNNLIEIFRSIGYRSTTIDDDLPFDNERGVISCETNNGHVTGMPGIYCCGWARTGPSGVILATLNEGRETAKIVVDDINKGNVPDIRTENKGFLAISAILESRGIKPVFFEQWERIDACEQLLGSGRGKPREKITDTEYLLELAHGVKECTNDK